jgi:hypothetical protein
MCERPGFFLTRPGQSRCSHRSAESGAARAQAGQCELSVAVTARGLAAPLRRAATRRPYRRIRPSVPCSGRRHVPLARAGRPGGASPSRRAHDELLGRRTRAVVLIYQARRKLSGSGGGLRCWRSGGKDRLRSVLLRRRRSSSCGRVSLLHPRACGCAPGTLACRTYPGGGGRGDRAGSGQ